MHIALTHNSKLFDFAFQTGFTIFRLCSVSANWAICVVHVQQITEKIFFEKKNEKIFTPDFLCEFGRNLAKR